MTKIYKPFKINDLFKINTTKLRINANTVTIYNYKRGFPYVVRTSQNNGIRGYIEFDEQYLNPANTISFGQDTATMFYQDTPYFTGDKIKILTLKNGELNYKIASYLLTCMRKAFSLFSWGQSKFEVSIIGSIEFDLPIVTDKRNLPVIDYQHKYHPDGFIPDFDYMQERIAELEQERIAELEQHLITTGLNDYKLTKKEIDIIKNTTLLIRKDFSFGYLFKAETGNVDLQQKDINGRGCYFINSGLENDGIKGKTDRPAKVFPKNTITIDFWGNAFYRPFEYKLATHNHVFSLSGEVIKNEPVGLYLVSQMMYLRKIFSYAEMGTWNKIKVLDLSLPIKTDKDKTPILDADCKYHKAGYIPDFDYMEKYIHVIQKIVIADVVKYKDEIISHIKDSLNK